MSEPIKAALRLRIIGGGAECLLIRSLRSGEVLLEGEDSPDENERGGASPMLGGAGCFIQGLGQLGAIETVHG
jgi:hypothetical protein